MDSLIEANKVFTLKKIIIILHDIVKENS